MELALYAHPFDLEALAAQGGLQRLADLGYREIALATSYHDGRWLQPWHPQGRVRFLEDGTVHYRPRADHGELRPLPSSSVPAHGPSPLERLCAAAPRHGLRTRAWHVFLHNSRLGAAHPGLCVQNAFGDRYLYALCPAQPAVQQYALAMVHDVAAHAGLHTLECEALGWMGWKHSSHHDKSSFAPRGWLEYAMSVCFCPPCRAAIAAAGGDPEATRRGATAFVQRAIENGCAMDPVAEPDAGEAERVFAAVRAARAATIASFGRALREALGPAVGCALQVHPDERFTGSQLPLRQAVGLRADQHVVTAYNEGPAAIGAQLDGVAASGAPGQEPVRRLSIWPRAPSFTNDQDLVKVRELAESRGVTSIAIYHLGLLPWRTIERAARVLTA